MKPHPRIRKTIKWGGAAVTVLLVVVWIGSGWWYGSWLDEWRRGVVVNYGRIDITGAQPNLEGKSPVGLWSRRHRFGLVWKPAEFADGDRGGVWLQQRRLSVSLWLPALLSALPTGIAWHLDTLARRRDRLSLCPKCNYDRAGLAVGAVCPECGASGGAGSQPTESAPHA